MSRKIVGLYAGLALGIVIAGCLPDDGGGGGGGGTITFEQGYVFVRDDEIYVADSSNYQEAAALTNEGGNKQPSLSADGLQAVYVHVEDGAHSIRAVATGGSGTPRTLYAAAEGERNFRTPVFSPDGSRVVFAFEDSSGISQLAVVNADGSGGFQAFTAPTISYASPSFYADGEHVLAMTGTAPAYDALEKINIDDGTVTVIASSLGGEAEQIANRVMLSPDETKVVFDARIAGSTSGVSRIFVKDIATATTDPVQLTEHLEQPGALDFFPAWVSNSRVSFSSNSGGIDAVYEINISVTEPSGGSLTVGSAREGYYSL